MKWIIGLMVVLVGVMYLAVSYDNSLYDKHLHICDAKGGVLIKYKPSRYSTEFICLSKGSVLQ